MAIDVNTLRALAAARPTASRARVVPRRVAAPSNWDAVLRIAQSANAMPSSVTPDEQLNAARDKLTRSIQAIQGSDAPAKYKESAASKAPEAKDSENPLERALNLLGKPKTAIVAGVARMIDDERNFLKDLQGNVGVSDVLSKADWYKSLPAPAKIGVGLVGDIALDPLTYVAPQSLIGKLGGAEGIASQLAAKSLTGFGEAKALASAGDNVAAAAARAEAELAQDLGGRLVMKGKGGIGGLSNAELKQAGQLIGQDLRGGLYFNVPGTGRVAQTLKGWAGLDPGEVRQVFLGRTNAMRAASRGLSKARDAAVLSYPARAISDARGGGEGQIKRLIKESASPADAVTNLVFRNVDRQSMAVGSRYWMALATDFQSIVDDANKAGIDGVTLYRALGGKTEAVDAVKASSRPDLYERVLKWRDDLRDLSTQMGQEALRARGADPALMGDVIPNTRRNWQPSVRTEDAATDMAASTKRKNIEATFGPAKYAEHVEGGEFLGVRLADPNENMWRMASVNERGSVPDGFPQMGHETQTLATVRESELLADPQYAARIAAGEDINQIAVEELRLRAGQSLKGTPKVRLSKRDVMSNEALRAEVKAGKSWRQVAEEEAVRIRDAEAKGLDTSLKLEEDSYRVFRDGKYKTVPESRIVYEPVPADPLGRTVREQVNAINTEAFGYGLFDEDLFTTGRTVMGQFARAHTNELRGALLKHFGLAEDLDIPGSVAKANRRISKAAKVVEKQAARAAKAGDKAARRQSELFAAEAESADRLQTVINETADAINRLEAGSPQARRLEQELGQLVEEHAQLTDQLLARAEELAPDNADIKMMRRQIQGERSKGTQSILGVPEVPVAAMTGADLEQHLQMLDSDLRLARVAGEDLVRELENARQYEDVVRQVGPMTRSRIIALRAEYRRRAAAEAYELDGLFQRLGALFDGFPTKATRGPLKGQWVHNGQLVEGGEWDWFKNLDKGTQDAFRRRFPPVSSDVLRSSGVDEVMGEWAAINGLDNLESGVVEDSLVDAFQRLRTAEAIAKPNSDLRLVFAPLGADDTFRIDYGITPEQLFGGRVDNPDFLKGLNDQEIYHWAELQQGLTEPQSSVLDLEAELRQLEVDTKNLRNRRADAEAEINRRAQLHADLDATAADAINEIAPEVRMAHGAINADPKNAAKVTKAVEGLTTEVPRLPTPPPFAVLTSETMPSRVAAARARVDAMNVMLEERLRKVGLLTAEQQMLSEDAARIRTNISRIENDIRSLDNEFRAADTEGNMARSRLNRTEADINKELVHRREVLMAALEAETREADRLWHALDELKYKEFLYSDQAVNQVKSLVRDGWVRIGRNTQVPEWHLGEAMAAMARMDDPQFNSKLLKYFDKLTRLFKAWAVATPGFIARNGYSGMWMNYMFDITPGSYRSWLAADRAYGTAIAQGLTHEQALGRVAASDRKAFQMVIESGVLDEGSQISSYRQGLNRAVDGKPSNWVDRAADTPINRATSKMNTSMERVLRGAAAFDVAGKTGSVDRIYDIVYKAHFNYADINNLERQLAVRVSPFYIYFRKALPAMIEGVFMNPKAFARVIQFKNTIESVTPPEDLVPTWMRDRMSIRLPLGFPGGQGYLMPDLPVNTLTMLTDPKEVLGSVNPLIKLPLEMRYNSKVYFGESSPFQGLVQAPGWLTAPGVRSITEAAGLLKRSTDGQLLIDDKVLYAMEQFMPLLGRARRLAPSEQRHQDRIYTNWLNFLFGASLRTNTVSDRKGEVTYRQKKIDAMAEELGKLGYGGYQQWTKQVVTSRKPAASDRRPYLTLISPKGGLGDDSPYMNVSMGNRKSAAEVLAELGSSGQLQAIAAASAASRGNMR